MDLLAILYKILTLSRTDGIPWESEDFDHGFREDQT
jgi:hypothetical protein